MNGRKPLWWVIGCGFILSLPVLITGFPALTHDGRVHEVWYTNFAAQFWSGDLYPRWLQNVDMGLGGPTFFFYPPTPFFITSLFQPIFAGQRVSTRHHVEEMQCIAVRDADPFRLSGRP